ncbi:aerotolerance regulator BatA, partial [Vibrio splendidus]
FHAMDRKQLEQAYATIDELEQQEFELLSHRPKHSLHHYAFGVCLVSNLLAALIVFGANLRRKKEIKRVIRRREELTND